jgi:hypothetical protein
MMKLPIDLTTMVLSFVEAKSLNELIAEILPWLRELPEEASSGWKTMHVRLKVHPVTHKPDTYDPYSENGWEPHIQIKKHPDNSDEPSPCISIFWEHWDSQATITYEDVLTTDFDLLDSAPRSVTELPELVATVSHIDYGQGLAEYDLKNFYQPKYLFRAKEYARMLE